MIYPLPANQHFFRVTSVGQTGKDVLAGAGAFYLADVATRYNVVLQQAAYASDSHTVAVTEAAFYASSDWQEQLARYHHPPLHGPLVSEALLWEFTVAAPAYVID